MQWSLFLLILTGHCSLFTCQFYKYHFIGENKTWDDAREFCRENYTDLATVYDMTDMERLLKSTENQDEAWIGLFSNRGQEKWDWSLPGVEFDEKLKRWAKGEPNNVGGHENCVQMTSQNWSDFPCTHPFTFICYNETKQFNKTFHLIDYEMTWPEAQRYCRENHTDLVSGLDQLDRQEVKYANNVWIGLFRDTWNWSDGSSFSFRYWENVQDMVDGQDNKPCATTVLNTLGKWRSDDCNKAKPFFCYDDNVILIKESKTWEDALNYCREKHHDLVSITNPHMQRWVQERAKNADSPHVWLGLRYTCTLDLWFWVSDELVCYDNWAPETNGANTDTCRSAAAMMKEDQHKWVKFDETNKFNFICSTF